MPAKIVVEGLYKIFGNDPDTAFDLLKQGLGKEEIFSRTGLAVGVQDASFEVMTGEIFVVMGLSGSGKSTLVRMFNRLIEPTAGSIRIDDEDVTAMSEAELIAMRRQKMSMVFQSFALFPNRTVYENASFGLEVTGIPQDQRRERTMEALDSVGLKAYADSLPQALSGGMRQRVGLARALATDPAILLMDEAFSALDPLIRAEMQDQLIELQKKHARTVIFVSHDLDEALKIGDRIAIMEHGRLVQVATPTEILREPANHYVRAFFRGVDVSQVFTLGEIAERREEMEVTGEETAARDALRMLEKTGGAVAAILDGESRFVGAVTAESLSAVVEQDGTAPCRDVLEPEIEAVASDTVLSDALEQVATSTGALPVVDEDRRFVGFVSRSDLLHALDRKNGGPDGATEKAAAAEGVQENG